MTHSCTNQSFAHASSISLSTRRSAISALGCGAAVLALLVVVVFASVGVAGFVLELARAVALVEPVFAMTLVLVGVLVAVARRSLAPRLVQA